MFRHAVLFWIVLLLVALNLNAQSRSVYESVGLLDYDGGSTSLQQQAIGRTLVVVVLKANWCRVCIDQLSRLAAERGRLDDLGATVVGVSLESVGNNRDTAEENDFPFRMLSDPDGSFLNALGVYRPDDEFPLPSLIVFDRCGSEAGRQEGRFPGAYPDPSLFRLLEALSADPPDCGDRV